MPDSAAGWRIEPPVSVPIPNGAWNAATAAAEPPLRAARDHVQVPGVAHRSERGPLVRRAHRELVHVRLAEDHGAGVSQPLGDVGVVRGDVALEDPRARGALAARHRDEVLQRDRQAEQRMEGVERRSSLGAGRGEAGVGRVRLGQRLLPLDHQPRVEGVVLALRDLEMRERQLARRDLAGPQARGQLVAEEASRRPPAIRRRRRGSAARR